MLEYVRCCPICDAVSFKHHLHSKDYTTTHESFSLQSCTQCGFIFTNPRPPADVIDAYYRSDKYVSHTGGGDSIIDKAYVIARTFTLRWKLHTITRYQTAGTLLDFGCGTGAFLNYCRHNGWAADGIEPSDEPRTKATALTNVHIKSQITTDMPCYDAITLWHVLEHIHELKDTLQAIISHLKKTGTLFIAVPNPISADARHYQQYWAGYDVPRHLWHFTKPTMSRLLEKVGLKIVAIKPMKLDAYYVSLLSEGYQNPHQPTWLQATKAALRGALSNVSASKTGEYSSLIYIAKHQ